MPKHFYGLLTVRLANPPATETEVMDRLKTVLGISAPVLDEELGLVHGALAGNALDTQKHGEKNYVIGVELSKLWELVKSGHPNVVGCLHSLAYQESGKPFWLKKPPMPEYKKPKGPGF